MTASFSTGRGGKKHGYYHCHGCGARHRKTDLETKIDGWIRHQSLKTSPVLRQVASSVSKYARQAEAALSARRDKALRRAENLSGQIRRLQDFALKGLIPEDEFTEKNAALREDRRLAMEEANARDTATITASAILDACVALLNDVPKLMLYATPKVRKALFDVICGSTVVVERDGTCRTAQTTCIFNVIDATATPGKQMACLSGAEWNRLGEKIKELRRICGEMPAA